MTKDEMKNKISMALKDPILQQGFEIICKNLSELEEQIEEMKCGGNCKHLYHVNTGGCYDAKCDLTGCDCINCKDEWEFEG